MADLHLPPRIPSTGPPITPSYEFPSTSYNVLEKISQKPDEHYVKYKKNKRPPAVPQSNELKNQSEPERISPRSSEWEIKTPPPVQRSVQEDQVVESVTKPPSNKVKTKTGGLFGFLTRKTSSGSDNESNNSRPTKSKPKKIRVLKQPNSPKPTTKESSPRPVLPPPPPPRSTETILTLDAFVQPLAPIPPPAAQLVPMPRTLQEVQAFMDTDDEQQEANVKAVSPPTAIKPSISIDDSQPEDTWELMAQHRRVTQSMAVAQAAIKNRPQKATQSDEDNEEDKLHRTTMAIELAKPKTMREMKKAQMERQNKSGPHPFENVEKEFKFDASNNKQKQHSDTEA